jgi:hypothetical protein
LGAILLANAAYRHVNICVIEGLIALNDGRVNEAIQYLDSSTKACQADVDSSVHTSLLPPNLELAEKLLERGERTAATASRRSCSDYSGWPEKTR